MLYSANTLLHFLNTMHMIRVTLKSVLPQRHCHRIEAKKSSMSTVGMRQEEKEKCSQKQKQNAGVCPCTKSISKKSVSLIQRSH